MNALCLDIASLRRLYQSGELTPLKLVEDLLEVLPERLVLRVLVSNRGGQAAPAVLRLTADGTPLPLGEVLVTSPCAQQSGAGRG